MNYKHILAAVDFSDISEQVCQRALSLAEFYGSNLSIITVLEDMPVYPEPFGEFSVPAIDAEQWQGLKETTSRKLEALKERCAGDQIVFLEVLSGSPKVEITEYAKVHNVDLIVLGSHGHRGVLSLLGSTTDGVNHRSGSDVLTIRSRDS